MVLSLVIAACGPAATTPTTPTTPTAEEPQKEVVKPAAEMPKYGGTVVIASSSDMAEFDTLKTRTGNTATNLCNGKLWVGG